MLLDFNIKNILIIDSVSASFSNNLNVITGETGSGKSVILESLLMALGAKNINLSPQNAEKGIITVEFDISQNKPVQQILTENEIEFENTILIKKTITASRSISSVNDVQVTSQLLRNISENLIEVYGQHDFSSLFSKKGLLEIIDNYSNNFENLKVLAKIYNEIKQLTKTKENLIAEFEKNIKDKEYFENAISEIDNLNIEENEEEILSDKLSLIKKSGKILESLSNSLNALKENNFNHNILQQIRSLSRIANNIEGSTKQKIEEINNNLDKAVEFFSAAENSLENILDEANFSERQLQELGDRLYNIKELSRKYRLSSGELNNFCEDLRNKVKLLNNSDAEIKKIENEIKIQNENYKNQAEIIPSKRKKAAKEIETKVNKEFPELKMNGAKFLVDVSMRSEININGFDEIEFLIATNPNQQMLPIAKVASGGEISRVMLALKIAISEKTSGATLIFDEIDTGISGSTVEAVGKRLKALSQKTQTIVITHQPQVASKASKHFMVQKITSKNKSEITFRELTSAQSSKEVARIISGEDY